MRTLGLGRARGTCLERLRSNIAVPRQGHVGETDHETRSCQVVSFHTDLRLEFVELIECHISPFGLLSLSADLGSTPSWRTQGIASRSCHHQLFPFPSC